jgi:transcriptional regulator with XRE-family HTH domain
MKSHCPHVQALTIGSAPLMPVSTVIALAVGGELRRLRQRAGLSQAQVAVYIESHRPIIARIESGRHVPTLETCELFVAVCGGSLVDVGRAIDRAVGLHARTEVA